MKLEAKQRLQANDDFLSVLFGNPPAGNTEEHKHAEPEPVKVDKHKLIQALRDFVKTTLAEANDWNSRQYKENKKQVHFEGDGPTRNESISVKHINDLRKNKRVDMLQNQAQMASNFANRIERGFNVQAEIDSVLKAVNRRIELHNGQIESGYKTKDDMIEGYISGMILGDPYNGHGPDSVAHVVRQAFQK